MFKKYIFLCILCILCITCGCNNTEMSTEHTVNIFEITEPGIYQGEKDNSIPHGTGTFTTENGIVVTGTWNNGILSGKATIVYPDEKELAVWYKNGYINGRVTETYPDGTYCIYSVKDGVCTGTIKYYNANKKYQKTDWFYHGTPINELVKSSAEPDYSQLLANSSNNLAQPFAISGEVISIFNDKDNCYLKIEDDKHQLFIGVYKNTVYNNNQAMVPNFSEGDSVIVYGLFQGSTELSSIDSPRLGTTTLSYNSDLSINKLLSSMSRTDTKGNDTFYLNDPDFDNTIPFLSIFYGEYQDSTLSLKRKDLSYNTLSKYSMFYNNTEISIDATIVYQNINYTNNKIYMIVEDTDNNLYYTYYRLHSNLPVYSVGTKIHVIGKIKGNRKVQQFSTNASLNSTVNYLICPLLQISDLSN